MTKPSAKRTRAPRFATYDLETLRRKVADLQELVAMAEGVVDRFEEAGLQSIDVMGDGYHRRSVDDGHEWIAKVAGEMAKVQAEAKFRR
ncbi:hypothetical protein [Alienimonas sp. DA493]|uniref:hypothetical protein n=1 Tax=Alienimonas sp. DA493 TaxID=3373605 RepID=UPI003754E057